MEMARSESVSDPARTDWLGDDQQWWDWYMTLASQAPDEFAEVAPDPERSVEIEAPEYEVHASLAAPYALAEESIAFFRRNGYVRLRNMVPSSVVAALSRRVDELLDAMHGTGNDGRFLAVEQVWLTDPLVRGVTLSRRFGDVAAQLMGVEGVRLYHDNILSKEPGCGRTPWHRDHDHYPLASPSVCTSWFPLQRIPAAMGTLTCLPRTSVPGSLLKIPVSVENSSYDERVEAELRASGVVPDSSPFELGEVSFHAADCFHTAGPNRTGVPRRVLSSTYYADGTNVVDSPTVLSGKWKDFLPGVAPGTPAVSTLNPLVGSTAALSSARR